MKRRICAALTALALAQTLVPPSALALEVSPPETPQDTLETFDIQEPAPASDTWEFVPGVIPEDYELIYPDSASIPSLVDASTLPKAYRSEYQSSVKNQGSNGLCWTFATYAALEANLKKNGFGEQNFSELHMAYSTSNRSENTEQGWDRLPHDGGHRGQSSAYLMRGTNLSGTVDEKADPYDTNRISTRDLYISQQKEQTYSVKNILFLTGNEKPDEATNAIIKQHVLNYGGVAGSMYWDGTATSDGASEVPKYYNASTSSYYFNESKKNEYGNLETNHLVEIAGWDDDYPVSNFSKDYQPKNSGAWLVKNSWGTGWGDNGYVWISYEDTNFPLGTFCMDGARTYDSDTTVYETDYKGNGGSLGYNDKKLPDLYAAKVFTAATDGEKLQSVRIFVPDALMSVDIDCVENFSDISSLKSHTFTSNTKEGTLSLIYPGWYTIDFATPVTLGAKDSKFAVLVKFSGETPHVAYNDENTPVAGMQYTAYSNTSWVSSTDDLCIKAVTKPETENQATINKVAADLKLMWPLIKGKNTEMSTVNTDLALMDSFKYGTSVTWASNNTSVIDATGKVTLPTANTNVTLTATVTKGSATATTTFDLTVLGAPASDVNDVKSAIDSITWDSIKNANTNQNEVNSALTLTASPTASGVSITWTSSNSDLINPTNGTVTQPRFDKLGTVTLTATAKKGNVVEEKTFELTVSNKDETDADKFAAAKEWLQADSLNHWWPLIKGENESWSKVRYDLVVPTKVSVPMEKGGNFEMELGSAAARKKEDKSEAWSIVTDEGKVTRPDFGQPDSEGYFFLFSPLETTSITSKTLTLLAYKGFLTVETQPLDTSLEAGTTKDLTVGITADGTPGILAYQWYQTDSATRTSPTPVPGATSATFSIPTSLAAGTYYYYCEVSALDAKPVTSDVATVTVTESVKPTPVDTKTSLEVTPVSPTYGDTLTLTASVKSGENPLEDGTIAFKDGDTVLEAAAAVRDGTATCKTSNLPATDHAFTAEFTPADASKYNASISSSVSVTIARKPLTEAMVALETGSYTYDKTAKTPEVTVTDGSPLTKDKDFTVEYEKNTNAGTATAIVTGTGNYANTIRKDFTIAKAASSLSVSSSSVSLTIGQTQKITPTLTGVDSEKLPDTVIYTSSDDTIATVSTDGTITAKSVGTATVTVTFAGNDNYAKSTAEITVGVSEIPAVAAPVISPAPDEPFTDRVEVTITCDTADATIYYTTDGIDPTTSSKKYTTPFTLTETAIVKAIAVKAGMKDSEIVTASYTKTELETVKTPVIAPVSSTFAESVEVTITCDTTGATIYYTTDGIDPTTSSKKYTIPFTLTETTTVKAIAVKADMKDSEIVTTSYTKTEPKKTVETPVIDPSSGTFTESVEVTITCDTTGANIYYTTDGTNPTTSSTKYTIPFTLTETATIKAIAVKADMEDSAIATATYTKTEPKETVATPVIDPASGSTYTDRLEVTITCATEGANIYYTTDGKNPTTASTKYEKPFTLTNETTVKAIAVKTGMEDSTIATAFYTKTEPKKTVATPVINPASSTFTDSVEVTITCDTADAIIYYTTDGKVPTTANTKYEKPFTLTNETTVKAIAVKSGMENSAIATATYTKTELETVATPVIEPSSSTFTDEVEVTITCDTIGATIYYTTDDGDPRTTGMEYEEPFLLMETATVKAIAIKEGMEDSAIATATYTKMELETVATPVIDPASGTFTDEVEVTITCDTTGATIYYTTDGGDPKTTGMEYEEPFLLVETATVKAIAVKEGMKDSAIATATYTKTEPKKTVVTPVIVPASGTFTESVEVTITCDTTGASIYYTTDGTNPTTSNTKYAKPFLLVETATIKAIAVKEGMEDSAIATATYTKTEPKKTVATPVIVPASGTFTESAEVTIICDTTEASIYYTTDGSLPTTSSTKYEKPFVLAETTTVKAIAVKEGMENSSIATATYTKVNLETVATPVINPASGTYTDSVEVRITCATEGASIYYTTDGSDPTTTSTKYVAPFRLTTTTTVKAIAVKDAMKDSIVTYAVYTVNQSSPSTSSPTGSSSFDREDREDRTTVSRPVVREDGSKTTTQKDRQGTVTKTTKYTDGSQKVVETKKDGTVTTTETGANGNKTETVAKADGSRETKMETPSGATSRTTVDAAGKVKATVELPEKAIQDAHRKQETVTLPMPEVPAAKDTAQAASVAISAADNAKIKVEIPVKKPSAGTVAVMVHPDGSEEIIKASTVTEKGVALNVSGSVTIKIVDNSKPFADVASSSWAKDSIDFVSARELFQGTSQTSFAPEAEMTRSMLVTVLFRLDGEKKSNVTNHFSDISNGLWYTDAVAWASSTGVVQGVGDGSFAPDASIDRESLCVMIYRYAKTLGLDGTSGSLRGFTDQADVSAWASEAMSWAVGSGIINGKNGAQLDPQGKASRAEVAAILERLVNLNLKDS